MFNIGIIGCGPAGLSAAVFLHDQGHTVTLYERFSEARAVGSGLMLQPTGLSVLDRLGLRRSAESLGQRIDGMIGKIAPNGKVVLDIRYGVLAGELYGVAIHRASLFHVLYEAVLQRSIPIISDVNVTGIAHSMTHVSVKASHNTKRGMDNSHDFIVDASGRQSKLISHAERKPKHTKLSYGALWGTVRYDANTFNPKALEQRYKDAKVMVGILPCGRLPDDDHPLATFFWSLRNDAYESTKLRGIEAWKKDVASYWPDTAGLLEQFSSFDQLAHAKYSHHTLPRPYGNRVVFIGDAAHSTSPQLGQGANMALLDSYALSSALLQTENIAEAFMHYAQLRRLHVRLFQAASLTLTPFYQSDNKPMPWLRDLLFEPVSKMPFVDKLVASLGAGMIAQPMSKLDALNKIVR